MKYLFDVVYAGCFGATAFLVSVYLTDGDYGYVALVTVPFVGWTLTRP